MKVIRAGRLIDGTGAAVQRDRALFVEDGLIVGVGAAGEAPADAELVDLSNLTVLPGLIDCHVHLVFSYSAHPWAICWSKTISSFCSVASRARARRSAPASPPSATWAAAAG